MDFFTEMLMNSKICSLRCPLFPNNDSQKMCRLSYYVNLTCSFFRKNNITESIAVNGNN